MDEKNNLVGVVVSKLEPHRGGPLRGYIAMLAVREEYRGKGIATKLVCMAIDAMIARDADEVSLKTLRYTWTSQSPPPTNTSLLTSSEITKAYFHTKRSFSKPKPLT